MTKWHGGKGSSPRPRSVSEDEFNKSWDLIFGGKDQQEKSQEALITQEVSTETNASNTESQK